MKIRYWFGLFFLLVGIVCFLWGFWPIGNRSILDFTLPFEGVENPVSLNKDSGHPTLSKQISLVGPERLRAGEDAMIKLRIDPSDPGNVPRVDDLQNHYNLVVGARLEVDGTLSSPVGEVFSPLSVTQPTVIEWKIRPEAIGQVDGILWLHLNLLPLDNNTGELPSKRILIAAPQITFPVTSFFGLGTQTIKIIGIVAAGLGFFMVFESSLGKLLKKNL